MRGTLVGSVIVVALVGGGATPALAASASASPSPSTSASPSASASPSPTDSPTASAPPSGPVPTAPASLATTGTWRDGSVVRVDPAHLDWTATPTSTSIAWLRDGQPIAGATAATRTLSAADVGHRVQARVTAAFPSGALAVTSGKHRVQPGVTSERRLRAAIVALGEQLPGRYAVRVSELDGGKRQVAIGDRGAREPASTFKLFVAYATYRSIDAGAWHYGDRLRSGLTVRQCLRAMIEPSDNYCAADLRLRYGTKRLDRLVQAHGWTDTHFWYDSRGTKVTSARDVTALLSSLARGTLLSKASTAALTKQLETQVWREAIPPALTDGVRQASKPGTLWTSTGVVQTDAAIVWGPESRFVLTVLGYRGATIPSITRIAKLVYRELEGPAGKRFVYDRQQMRTTAAVTLTSAVARSSKVLGRYRTGTKVEVIDSLRARYLVRIAGRTGWIDNAHLTLRHPIL